MEQQMTDGRVELTRENLKMAVRCFGSSRKIATHLGWSQTNIRHHLKKHGLTTAIVERRRLPPWDVGEVRALAAQCATMGALAAKLGLPTGGNSYTKFVEWLKSTGIDIGRILKKTGKGRRPEQALAQPPLSKKNTNLIGDISTLEIASQFKRLGYIVYMPMGEGYRTDMIVEDRCGALSRIQAKTVAKGSPRDSVWIRVTRRGGSGDGHYVGHVEHIVAYDRRDGNVYAVAPVPGVRTVTLRKKRPKKNAAYEDARDCELHRAYPSQW